MVSALPKIALKPVSAGIPQMNRHFWPKRKRRRRKNLDCRRLKAFREPAYGWFSRSSARNGWYAGAVQSFAGVVRRGKVSPRLLKNSLL